MLHRKGSLGRTSSQRSTRSDAYNIGQLSNEQLEVRLQRNSFTRGDGLGGGSGSGGAAGGGIRGLARERSLNRERSVNNVSSFKLQPPLHGDATGSQKLLRCVDKHPPSLRFLNSPHLLRLTVLRLSRLERRLSLERRQQP